MTFVPTVYDYAIVAFVVAAEAGEILLMPILRKRCVLAHAYMTVYLWVGGIAILVLWTATGRSWNGLWLGETAWWRLVIGFAIAAGYIAFMTYQRAKLLQPKYRKAVTRAMAAIDWMMPRTQNERVSFVALSVAAGVCEEIIFRGFALTLFAAFVGLPAAIVLSMLGFGLCHAYQNRAAILSTGAFGLAMTAVVLISGSLLPAIAIHIFQDLIMADVAYNVLAAPAEHVADDRVIRASG